MYLPEVISKQIKRTWHQKCPQPYSVFLIRTTRQVISKVRESFQFPRKTYKLEKQEPINYRSGNYSTVSCLQRREPLNILDDTISILRGPQSNLGSFKHNSEAFSVPSFHLRVPYSTNKKLIKNWNGQYLDGALITLRTL